MSISENTIGTVMSVDNLIPIEGTFWTDHRDKMMTRIFMDDAEECTMEIWFSKELYIYFNFFSPSTSKLYVTLGDCTFSDVVYNYAYQPFSLQPHDFLKLNRLLPQKDLLLTLC